MKKRSHFDEMMDEISSAISLRKTLYQDMISRFMKELSEDSDFLPDILQSVSYKTMRNQLYEIWQYQEWRDMSSEQAFLYGQLYGCARMYEYQETSRDSSEWMTSLVSRYEQKLWLFRAVKQNPGIRHKDLALCGKISPSMLSQFMDQDEMKKLLSHRVLGREKHYFLSPAGEELLSRLEEKRKKESATNWKKLCDVRNKSITSNNINIPTYVAFSREIADTINAYKAIVSSEWEPVINKNQLKNDVSLKIVRGETKCLVENGYREQMNSLLAIGLLESSAR